MNCFYYKNKNLRIKSLKDNIMSHNKMNAFFSGEDIQTLTKEGFIRNHFLSLIVNNKGEYVAAITRKVKIESGKTRITYKTFGDTEVSDYSDKVVMDEYVERVKLDVVMPENKEELILKELNDNTIIPVTNERLLFTDEKPHRNDYPTLFKDDSGVDTGKVTQVYNRLVTGSLGFAPCDKKLQFNKSLDKYIENDDEAVYNFVTSAIENLSAEELQKLLEMLEGLDSSLYINACIECVNNNLEYYEY